MFAVPLLVHCIRVKRLRHAPGGGKNLTNVNFAGTRESMARGERHGNSITRPLSDGELPATGTSIKKAP